MGDRGTRRQGDQETRGQGDKETRRTCLSPSSQPLALHPPCHLVPPSKVVSNGVLRIAILSVAMLPILFVLAAQATGSDPQPTPELAPDEVVRIQLDALKENRVDIVFRFASPENRAYTGPLSRFTEMLQSPAYLAILNHRSAIYGPLRKESGQAYQSVIVVPPGGQAVGYVFVLSKYYSSGCDGCWLTDSVTRFEPEKPLRGT